MEKVRLSDGRETEVITFAIASTGHMFIRVNMSIGEAYNFFSSGTDRILYSQANGDIIAISGFSELAYIVNEPECVRVALIRPMNMEVIEDGRQEN